MKVTVWICPSFGCGNYFASSSAGDLGAEFNTNQRHEPTFSRAQCPDCRRQGRNVQRLKVVFEDGLDGARNVDLDQRMAAREEST